MINMSKTISISDKVYEQLAKRRAKGQSFSGVIEETLDECKILPIKIGCDHKWDFNMFTNVSTCQKCGHTKFGMP